LNRILKDAIFYSVRSWLFHVLATAFLRFTMCPAPCRDTAFKHRLKHSLRSSGYDSAGVDRVVTTAHAYSEISGFDFPFISSTLRNLLQSNAVLCLKISHSCFFLGISYSIQKRAGTVHHFFFPMALRPNAGRGFLIFEVSRSHTTTHHSR
jgi:hypothetical protein